MNLSEYWIGDHVSLKKSKRNGIFEGITDKGKARIRIGKNIVITTASNLELLEIPKDSPELSLSDTDECLGSTIQNETQIDLHIESLAPELTHALPQQILMKQLSAAKSFIERSIQSHIPEVIIIHGVGKGQLRTEVEHLLDGFSEVFYSRRIHNEGATHVTFKYSRHVTQNAPIL